MIKKMSPGSHALVVCLLHSGAWAGSGAPMGPSGAAKHKPMGKGAVQESSGYPSLILKGGAESCLAYLPQGNDCLLTVANYNREVFALPMVSSGAFMQVPGGYNADSSRFWAMKSILYNLFKEKRLHSAGLDSSLDSVSASACRQVGVRDDTALSKRLLRHYNAHYDARFKTRRVPVFNVIAASDSDSIRSIYLHLERQKPLLNSRDTAVSKRAKRMVDSMPWWQADLEDLDAAAAKAALALQPFRWSAPIRTPYGSAILCASDSAWTQETFFQSVRDSLRLVLKAQDDSFLKQAESYYRANPRDFRKPDTLFFRLSLCPDSNCIRKTGKDSALPVLGEYSMPAPFRGALRSAYESRAPDSIWIETPLGYARMRISRIGRGRGSRPFGEVEWEISKRIDAQTDSLDSGSVKCRQIRQRVADLFVPYLYPEVADRLYAQNLRPGEKTQDRGLYVLMKDARSRFRAEFDSWMGGLDIGIPKQ